MSNVIAEAGQSHEVICSLKPTEFSLTYEWTVGEILLQRRGSNVYRFSEVLTSDARNDYACIVHRTNGQEFSLNWTFTVFCMSLFSGELILSISLCAANLCELYH